VAETGTSPGMWRTCILGDMNLDNSVPVREELARTVTTPMYDSTLTTVTNKLLSLRYAALLRLDEYGLFSGCSTVSAAGKQHGEVGGLVGGGSSLERVVVGAIGPSFVSIHPQEPSV
jgi:hypothetical protein